LWKSEGLGDEENGLPVAHVLAFGIRIEGFLRAVHAGVGVVGTNGEVLRQRIRKADLPVVVGGLGIVADTAVRTAELLLAVVQVEAELFG
jgi:hypothetical protein